MEKKDEKNTFAPWEEEKNYKSRGIKRSIPPSNQKTYLTTKTNSKDHEHLEMYILSREKERLENYGSTLGRRVKSIADSWKRAKARMYELQKEGAKVNNEGIEELAESKKKEKKESIKGNIQKKEWNY